MNLRGQDKGRGQTWPKSLSAYLIAWDAMGMGRDVDSAQSPIGLGYEAGTWRKMTTLKPIFGDGL